MGRAGITNAPRVKRKQALPLFVEIGAYAPTGARWNVACYVPTIGRYAATGFPDAASLCMLSVVSLWRIDQAPQYIGSVGDDAVGFQRQ